MQNLKLYLSGLFVCLCIALLTILIHDIYGSPSTLIALLLGIGCHAVYKKQQLQKGIDFCSKDLLRFAIMLLGLRIAIEDIFQLGLAPVLITLTSSFITIGLGLWIARTMKLSSSLGLMGSIAVAICGASATLAVAASLPPSKKKDKEVIVIILNMTLLSTLSMIFYPLLMHALRTSSFQAGIFLGSSIHDVAQVVGASYTMGDEVGEVAVFIKLIRIMMLAPLIMVLSLTHPHKEPQTQKPPLIPFFVIGFILCIALNSIHILPDSLHTSLVNTSHILILMALAALGLKIDLAHIIKISPQPLLFTCYCSLIIALSSLSLIYFFVP